MTEVNTLVPNIPASGASAAKASVASGQHAGDCYVSPGMPALRFDSDKSLSFFEFWPMWLMYLPVVLQWLLLGVWHRSLTLPLLANPNLPISGMVGVPKSDLFNQAQGECAKTILTWFLHRVSEQPITLQVESILKKMQQMGLEFPIVCKPDIGCRGSGVKLIHNSEQLEKCIEQYPRDSGVLIQRLASWEPEAGVFYVREPQSQHGEIISLALKYMPYVVGDGSSTLGQLIAQDKRASQLQHLYKQRHLDEWDKVLEKNKTKRLIFSASHCRGAIFRDGNHLVTKSLTQKIDSLMKNISGFYYGRLDIKFSDIDSLQSGNNIEIVEINAASSEALHIWDKDTPFRKALLSLLSQYRLLFKLGAQNRRAGHVPPALAELVRRWRHEQQLNHFHPETD